MISTRIGSLRREVDSLQKGYSQVMDRVADYEKAKNEIASLEHRLEGGGGSLNSRVEAVAKKSGINVDQMKEKAPQETDFMEINSVEVKLSNITLPQLVEFLYNVENDATSPMRLRRIEIKPRFSNRQNLDVSFEVATFVLKKEV